MSTERLLFSVIEMNIKIKDITIPALLATLPKIMPLMVKSVHKKPRAINLLKKRLFLTFNRACSFICNNPVSENYFSLTALDNHSPAPMNQKERSNNELRIILSVIICFLQAHGLMLIQSFCVVCPSYTHPDNCRQIQRYFLTYADCLEDLIPHDIRHL